MGELVNLDGWRVPPFTQQVEVDLDPEEFRRIMWEVADVLGAESIREDIRASDESAAFSERRAERSRRSAEVLREWLHARGYAPEP